MERGFSDANSTAPDAEESSVGTEDLTTPNPIPRAQQQESLFRNQNRISNLSLLTIKFQ